MEKNFRNQLRDEVKRKKGLVDELRKAERRIEDLGKIISEKENCQAECDKLAEGKNVMSQHMMNFRAECERNMERNDNSQLFTS